jgi:hypothetical protein
MIFGGTSLQWTELPRWNTCAAGPGGIVLTDGSMLPWAELLTDEVSDELARAPYFQQYQLRGLLNSLDLANLNNADFEKGQLAAAYCEAAAWPGESVTDHDLHPDQEGYGIDNDHDSDGTSLVPFVQEVDEESTGTPKAAIKQPMVSLTKRAFLCSGGKNGEYDEELTDPNDLVEVNPDTGMPYCEEITDPLPDKAKVEVPSGSRVHWLYTVENTALFGFLKVPNGKDALIVSDEANPDGDPDTQPEKVTPCPLTWKLIGGPNSPSGSASFPAKELVTGNPPMPYADGVIAPGHARVCVYSEVLW